MNRLGDQGRKRREQEERENPVGTDLLGDNQD
jgi:hypothetical protein